MPTPIGHALAGLAVAGIGRTSRLPGRDAAILAFCACAPDLDLLLRLVDGANHHRGPSHSLGAVLLVAAGTLILSRLGLRVPGTAAMAGAWTSHLVLDYFGVDTSPPSGEMAWWPFSDAFYVSPVSLFYDIPRAFSAAAIRHNLVAVAIEVIVLAPLAWICWGRPRSGSAGVD